jgi:hypothetical protein
MNGLLAVNLVTSFVLLVLVAERAGMRFYSSMIPALIQPTLVAVISIVGLAVARWRLLWLLLGSAGLALMLIPWWYGCMGFEGGDDGGSLGWGLIVGAGSLAAFVVGVTTAIGGLVCHLHNRRRRAQPDLGPPAT